MSFGVSLALGPKPATTNARYMKRSGPRLIPSMTR